MEWHSDILTKHPKLATRTRSTEWMQGCIQAQWYINYLENSNSTPLGKIAYLDRYMGEDTDMFYKSKTDAFADAFVDVLQEYYDKLIIQAETEMIAEKRSV